MNEEVVARVGPQRHRKKKYIYIYIYTPCCRHSCVLTH